MTREEAIERLLDAELCLAGHGDLWDIDQEAFEMAIKALKQETVTEFADRCMECGKHAIHIPNNATNGDMIKAMFPKSFVMVLGTVVEIELYFGNGAYYAMSFDKDWWNAPYKRESEEE